MFFSPTTDTWISYWQIHFFLLSHQVSKMALNLGSRKGRQWGSWVALAYQQIMLLIQPRKSLLVPLWEKTSFFWGRHLNRLSLHGKEDMTYSVPFWSQDKPAWKWNEFWEIRACLEETKTWSYLESESSPIWGQRFLWANKSEAYFLYFCHIKHTEWFFLKKQLIY